MASSPACSSNRAEGSPLAALGQLDRGCAGTHQGSSARTKFELPAGEVGKRARPGPLEQPGCRAGDRRKSVRRRPGAVVDHRGRSQLERLADRLQLRAGGPRGGPRRGQIARQPAAVSPPDNRSPSSFPRRTTSLCRRSKCPKPRSPSRFRPWLTTVCDEAAKNTPKLLSYADTRRAGLVQDDVARFGQRRDERDVRRQSRSPRKRSGPHRRARHSRPCGARSSRK